MKSKKVTYNLPIDIINQITKLKKETGKTKSAIIADLVRKTMTPEDKVISKNIANTLPQIDGLKKTDMTSGAIELKEKTDAVKLKKGIYMKQTRF